ncbi:MAG: thioredoxin domain-containing protein [Gemmatimonadota bacterium]|nr:thioredoxin domain-containing protein [Gemmatimonadota bacterium]MDE2873179.1 thioredoxin domain-containing protein [Gemmatimonadota bacterium]
MRSRSTKALDLALVACAVLTIWAVLHRLTHSPEVTDGATAFEGWQQDLMFDRRIGSADALYKLVVWFDYQCPACRRFEGEVDLARQTLADSVAVIYRHFPLSGHALAFEAAVAAECAREQSRFPEIHRALLASPLNGESLPLSSLMAQSNMPDSTSFRACMSDPTSVARGAVRADLARIRTLNVHGTPALQIGDRIATGGLPAGKLVERLREAADASR